MTFVERRITAPLCHWFWSQMKSQIWNAIGDILRTVGRMNTLTAECRTALVAETRAVLWISVRHCLPGHSL